jgi:hypothetical protein
MISEKRRGKRMAKKRKSPGSSKQGANGLKRVIRMVVAEELDRRMQMDWPPFPSPSFADGKEKRVKEPEGREPVPPMVNEWMEDWFAPMPEAETRAPVSESARRARKKGQELPEWPEWDGAGPWESRSKSMESRKKGTPVRERDGWED